MPEDISLKNYGRYATNPVIAMLLDRIAKRPMGMQKNPSPELGAMLQGEDFGIPATSDAQHIPYQAILEANPTIPIESALQLSGAYVYPERAHQFGTPMDYLQGHEESHLLDKLAQMKMQKSNFVPSEGIGNAGYQAVKNTDGKDMTTHAGIESWLLNYPPQNRPEERKAHLRGLEKHNLAR